MEGNGFSKYALKRVFRFMATGNVLCAYTDFHFYLRWPQILVVVIPPIELEVNCYHNIVLCLKYYALTVAKTQEQFFEVAKTP